MSTEPVTLKTLDDLKKGVERAREQLDAAKRILNDLNGNSQTTRDLEIGGVVIPLTCMGRETGWMARPINEFDDLRKEVIKGLKHLIWMRGGALEGAIHKLERACKKFARGEGQK